MIDETRAQGELAVDRRIRKIDPPVLNDTPQNSGIEIIEITASLIHAIPKANRT